MTGSLESPPFRQTSLRWTDPALNKVPAVTLAFWVIKIFATTIGETGADYLAFKMGLGLVGTAAVMTFVLIGALMLQVRAKDHRPGLYWLTVVLLSVVGTLLTDILTDRFGVSLFVSTAIFATLLGATFGVWFLREDTVSIHSIDTRRRELFYWSAILFTFALGTGAGDLVAEKLQWGYGLSALVFGSMIMAAAVAYYVFDVSFDLVFWSAYVMTRPFGASIGDLLSQPTGNGGLGFGAERVSAVFLAVILGLVILLAVRRRGTPSARARVS
ncbi:membrane protein [soil metagenome]